MGWVLCRQYADDDGRFEVINVYIGLEYAIKGLIDLATHHLEENDGLFEHWKQERSILGKKEDLWDYFLEGELKELKRRVDHWHTCFESARPTERSKEIEWEEGRRKIEWYGAFYFLTEKMIVGDN